ncbi:MAG TPA: glycosyltransferase family 4 protein [Gaiellaceae bacterium]|nr:glycosyltransferase family 4 protein [Gaiellaceae bacterium]
MRATFVYPNSRLTLLAGVAAGTEPDSTLLGANHLARHGVDVRIREPLLTRHRLPAPLDRVAWHARELILPFEIGRPDVLFTPLASILPLSARAGGIRTVVVNYGLNLISGRVSSGRRALLRRSLLASERVVCLGESQRLELVESIGIATDRTLTLLLPVDEIFYSPRPEPSGADTVLTVGKDLARDYGVFLQAVRDLDAPVCLAVHPRNLAGLELPSNAVAGLLSSVELREAYAEAACVVLPQHRDGYPYGSEAGGLTALLEAMAMGRPIVASERAIFRDYLDDGVEALVVPPEDPAALRHAIERVLADRRLAARLGRAARARVERMHTTRRFAALLAPVLRSARGPGHP